MLDAAPAATDPTSGGPGGSGGSAQSGTSERRLRAVGRGRGQHDGLALEWAGRYRTDRLGIPRLTPSPAEVTAARRAARRRLPAPAPVIGRLALAMLEVEAGCRSATQLEKCFRPEVWETLCLRLRRHGGPFVPGRALRRVMCQEPAPGLADGVAVVGGDRRVGFVAMRLDAGGGRWQVTHVGWGVEDGSLPPLA